MTETNGTAPSGEQNGDAPQAGEAQADNAQTFDAAYVERLRREAAKYRTEAKAGAEAKAQLEKALKAEATVEERVAAIEARAAAAEAKALRSDIAAEFGITAEDRDLFLTGSDEKTMRRQAERLADRNAAERTRNAAPYVAREGGNPTPAPSDERAAVRALFGGA